MSRGWHSTAVRTVLSFNRKITEQAGSYLKEGGKLCFEIGYDQGDEVRELMETNGFCRCTGSERIWQAWTVVVTGIWHKKP